MFIAVMDLTIVNVALPTIGHEFHVPAAGAAATVIGYQVSVALSIPAAAWLGDRLGQRQVFAQFEREYPGERVHPALRRRVDGQEPIADEPV